MLMFNNLGNGPPTPKTIAIIILFEAILSLAVTGSFRYPMLLMLDTFKGLGACCQWK